jgi:hypothetical protein
MFLWKQAVCVWLDSSGKILRETKVASEPEMVASAGSVTTMVRTALYEAAHIMLTRATKFSTLKRWAVDVAKRRGMKRAKVALARKLATILHRMWMNESEFRWEKSPCGIDKRYQDDAFVRPPLYQGPATGTRAWQGRK